MAAVNAVLTPPVFELEDVHFLYNNRQLALDGVNLRICEGEHVALLGANGSGKSTLLKVLDGLFVPSSGRLRLFGEEVANVSEDADAAHHFHRKVGLVFQDPDVQLFSPTVGDDVAFAAFQSLNIRHCFLKV